MKPAEGFIFDLDGTVYLGEKSLPGAVECIAGLRRMGKRILFISNKPLEPGRAYAEKLSRLGIPAVEGDIITSAFVLGYHLSHTSPELCLYVVGEPSLIAELRSHGLNVKDELFEQDSKSVIDPDGIDAVVIAFDRTLDYRKLNTAYQALVRGARFFSTNADKICPMPGGGIPDAGASIAALEHITGRKVELVAGKPSMLVMQVASQRLGLEPGRIMMVGDRLETDIIMGQQAGMQTAVVLTGVTKREEITGMAPPPDAVVENLGELLELVLKTSL
jgi:arabinose operon protein AraL